MAATKKSIKPLSDYVLIQPLDKETTTPSGIVIPDTAKEKPQEGKVTAVGPGRLNEQGERVALEVKEGDVIQQQLNCARFSALVE